MDICAQKPDVLTTPFNIFIDKTGKNVKRCRFTSIDDATRIGVLKIYNRHNQTSAIDFIDYVIDKFPFRIHSVRTDRGHEFQPKVHWHVEDKCNTSDPSEIVA